MCVIGVDIENEVSEQVWRQNRHRKTNRQQLLLLQRLRNRRLQREREKMTLGSETYAEYWAYCDRCGSQVIRVLESMDLKEWDERCGICSYCRKLFCKDCVVEKDDTVFCPDCNGELMDFLGCSVYDLIGILQHGCQPFKTGREGKETK
jgi:hypothetical protein